MMTSFNCYLEKAAVKILDFLDANIFPIDILEDKGNEKDYENIFR